MTEREQFEDWKATIGPETTSIQDIDDCMWLMAWAAWKARAASQPAQDDARYNAGFVAGQRYAEKHLRPAQEPVSLQRWGVKWKGQAEPFMEQMPDGYWTPWHIAQAALSERIEAEYVAGNDPHSQPAQEPVAWVSPNVIPLRGNRDNHHAILTPFKCAANTVSLYAAPPAAQAEPVDAHESTRMYHFAIKREQRLRELIGLVVEHAESPDHDGGISNALKQRLIDEMAAPPAAQQAEPCRRSIQMADPEEENTWSLKNRQAERIELWKAALSQQAEPVTGKRILLARLKGSERPWFQWVGARIDDHEYRYAHLAPSHLAKAVARIPRVRGGTRKKA
jgi:hypothetical protein